MIIRFNIVVYFNILPVFQMKVEFRPQIRRNGTRLPLPFYQDFFSGTDWNIELKLIPGVEYNGLIVLRKFQATCSECDKYVFCTVIQAQILRDNK